MWPLTNHALIRAKIQTTKSESIELVPKICIVMVVVIVKLFKIELKGYTALWFGENVCGRTLLKLFSAFRGFSLLSFYTTITFIKAFFISGFMSF